MAARRQNSSCDACRRLKRKCAFRGDPGPGNVCSNCSHLGYECTFEFATSQIERRKRKRRLDSAATTKQSARLPAKRATIHSNNAPTQEADSSWLDLTTLPNEPIYEEAFLDQPWSTGDSDVFTNTLAEWPLINMMTTSNIPSKQTSYTATTPTSNLSTPPCPTLGTNETYDSTRSLWSGSPMQLLNSSFSQSILGAYLGEVYTSVMKGLESRYLCYTCNPLAPNTRYCFDNIVPDRSKSSYTAESLAYLTTEGNSDFESAGEKPIGLTLVGLARFLDHFGKFYGNRIDKKTKQEDERLLLDAQQAFALQWSLLLDSKERNSSSDVASRLTTLWFKVRNQLLPNANPHLSFTSVLAMFLFQMTSAPGEPEDSRIEKDQFLSKAVCDLMALKELVEDSFRTTLASTPKYRNLLVSGLKIFEWFAYLKESAALLVTGKAIVLKNGLTYNSLESSWSPDRQPADADVPLICQKAVQYLSRLTWELNTIKKILDGDSPQLVDNSRISSLDDALVNSISIVEEFDSAFGQFCQYCIDNFLILSQTSQLSSSQLILFWNLIVLSLVEHIHASTKQYDLLPSINFIQEKIAGIEDSAISSTVAIARHITDISSNHGDKGVSGSSVLKLPFISHHLNLSQMAAILEKTIEHIIQRHASSNNQNTTESWMPSIKPLLSCLLDVGATFAGSRIAQRSLQRLTTTYGDVLMDAWIVDEDEVLFD